MWQCKTLKVRLHNFLKFHNLLCVRIDGAILTQLIES